MRILVCGGRDFTDKTAVYAALVPYLREYRADLEIVSGMAKGADHFAWLFSHHYDLVCHQFPADWEKHGRAAGPIRNQQMIDEGQPDLVIAFPGGKGTADMVRRAKAAQIDVIEVPN